MYVSLYNCMFVTINVRLNEINRFKPKLTYHAASHVVTENLNFSNSRMRDIVVV